MTESEKYERLVKHILESKASDSLKNFEVFGSRHYTGKSGHDHQIDVSVVFSLAGVRVIVLVECKCYSRRVQVNDVLEFATRLEDIGGHKGIIVSTVGFQEGAKKLAKSKGIALVVACDLGWVPTIEAPAAALLRHRDFLDTIRMHLLWLLAGKISEEELASASQRIGSFDVVSHHGLTPRPFCSLTEFGWGMRYASSARHGFAVVGEGCEDLVLDSTGMWELIAVQTAHEHTHTKHSGIPRD